LHSAQLLGPAREPRAVLSSKVCDDGLWCTTPPSLAFFLRSGLHPSNQGQGVRALAAATGAKELADSSSGQSVTVGSSSSRLLSMVYAGLGTNQSCVPRLPTSQSCVQETVTSQGIPCDAQGTWTLLQHVCVQCVAGAELDRRIMPIDREVVPAEAQRLARALAAIVLAH
jgi:hypothetical protein